MFANPRNAAAGSLKLLDPKITAARRLKSFVHSFGLMKKGKQFSTHWEFLQAAQAWGLRVNPQSKLCSDIVAVIAECKKWQEKRESLNYDTDGLVIKVNNFTCEIESGNQFGLHGFR